MEHMWLFEPLKWTLLGVIIWFLLNDIFNNDRF